MTVAKFHVNNKGEPGLCRVQTGICPFGEHYETKNIARKAYEALQENPFSKVKETFVEETFGTQLSDFYEDNVSCKYCGKVLTVEEMVQLVSCAVECSCREILYSEDCIVKLRKDCERFQKTEEILKADWWHATESDDWFNEVSKADEGEGTFVHLGTWHGAIDRGISITAENGRVQRGVWVHRIALEENSNVDPEIVSDEEIHRIMEKTYSGSDPNYVQPYLNIWEAPGSVSLLAHPRKFKVIESYYYEPEDFESFESLYNLPS